MSETTRVKHVILCLACGKQVTIPASRIGVRKFCSHACRVKVLGMPKGRRKAE